MKRRKRRRRQQKRKLSLILCAIILLITAAAFLLYTPELLHQSTDSLSLNADNHDSNALDLTALNSSYAILVKADTGDILAERNSTEQLYPASLTKIMTALVAVENITDLDQWSQLPADIFPDLYEQNASMAGFQPGEEVTLRDLLYGILLPSGAECCLAIADYIASSESAYVDMMNQKASELGMANTHFCNTTGLHDNSHYSTAEDLAVLVKYAVNNSQFREVFTSSSYTTSTSSLHPEGFTFYSRLFSSLDSPAVSNGEILGGKTGYTQEAQLCLASLAAVNGSEYILVTAYAEGSTQTEPFHVQDAVNVYNQIGSAY